MSVKKTSTKLTSKQIKNILERLDITVSKYCIKTNTITEDISIQLKTDFNLFKRLNVKKVIGNFDIYDLGITTLKGVPEIIDGHFDCSYNNLRSLKYGPKIVTGSYDCSNNFLRNLNDFDCNSISGEFTCCSNYITKLPTSFMINPANLDADRIIITTKHYKFLTKFYGIK